MAHVKIYQNKICPVCGNSPMAASHCRRVEGVICMTHCNDCKYLLKFMGGEWHCRYRAEDDREKQIAALYRKHDIQRKSAMPESTAPNTQQTI